MSTTTTATGLGPLVLPVTPQQLQAKYNEVKKWADALHIDISAATRYITALGDPVKLTNVMHAWSTNPQSIKNSINAMATSPHGLTGAEFSDVTHNWTGKAAAQFTDYISGLSNNNTTSLQSAMTNTATLAGNIASFLNESIDAILKYWGALLDIIDGALATINTIVGAQSSLTGILLGLIAPEISAAGIVAGVASIIQAIISMMQQIVQQAQNLFNLFQTYRTTAEAGWATAHTYIGGTANDHLPALQQYYPLLDPQTGWKPQTT